MILVSILLPKWAKQMGSFLFFFEFFCRIGPTWPQGRPKSAPRAPKSIPRAPKSPPRVSKSVPRTSKSVPRAAKIAPKATKHLKTYGNAQNLAKTLKNWAKTLKHTQQHMRTQKNIQYCTRNADVAPQHYANTWNNMQKRAIACRNTQNREKKYKNESKQIKT